MNATLLKTIICFLTLFVSITSCSKKETEIPEVSLSIDTSSLELFEGKIRAIPKNIIHFNVENGSCEVEDENGKTINADDGIIVPENLGNGFIQFNLQDQKGEYVRNEKYDTDLNDHPVYTGVEDLKLRKPVTEKKLDSLKEYIFDEEDDDYEISFDADKEELILVDIYGATNTYPLELLDEKLIYIRSLNGKILPKIQSELYQMIISDLKEVNNELALKSFGKVYILNEDGDAILNPDVRVHEDLYDDEDDLVFMYQPYYQTYKWLGKYALGTKTPAPDKRLEAIKFHTTLYMPDFWMKVMFYGNVWSEEGHTNEVIGTTGKSKRIESIQIYVPESVATHVYYRTCVRKVGWKKFHRNMEECGNYHGETQGFQMYMFNVK